MELSNHDVNDRVIRQIPLLSNDCVRNKLQSYHSLLDTGGICYSKIGKLKEVGNVQCLELKKPNQDVGLHLCFAISD